MMKCDKCHVDSAMYRATVMVCPKCHGILNAEQLFQLLEKLRISKELVEQIKKEIVLEITFS